MRAELRQTERVALRRIAEAQRDGDVPPTVRELAAAAQVSSTNAIAEAVELLARRGLIRRPPPRTNRGLRLAVGLDPADAIWIADGKPARRRFIPVGHCCRCGADHAEGYCTKQGEKPCELP